MTHYEKERWILYKNNLLSQEENLEMEDHLYTCDACMNIFLSLIDNEEESLAESALSSSFTEDIMKQIDSITPITKKTSKKSDPSNNKSVRKKKMIENIFMYYVAAASVVLVLTAGGAFTKMTEFPIASIAADTERTNQGLGKVYSFSQKITQGTNSFINNLGSMEIKKENKKDIKNKQNKGNKKNKEIFKKKFIEKEGGK
nr:hypothetical protein [Tissierella sp.]